MKTRHKPIATTRRAKRNPGSLLRPMDARMAELAKYIADHREELNAARYLHLREKIEETTARLAKAWRKTQKEMRLLEAFLQAMWTTCPANNGAAKPKK